MRYFNFTKRQCDEDYAAVVANKTNLCVTLQGQVHVARVMHAGVLKDSRGKRFFTLADWFQSVMGSNVPVSSAYVWDKVRHPVKLLQPEV